MKEPFFGQKAYNTFQLVSCSFHIGQFWNTNRSTVGKKILNLRVTDMYGNKPSLKGIMIGRFGKSFLLPIDVILELILTNEKRQRVFNKLGDALVVKIKIPKDASDISYSKD